MHFAVNSLATPSARRVCLLSALIITVGGAAGCVERVMKIRTAPEGALVLINDEEVGVTPTECSFVWYGDYDIVIRKAGYRTLKTHYRVNPPWHQAPPFDLFAENLYPGRIRDEHQLPTYELQRDEPPTVEETVKSATEMRERALSQY